MPKTNLELTTFQYTNAQIRRRVDGVSTLFANRFIELRGLFFDITKGHYELVPYSGVRTVRAQAKLWRQSKTTWEINTFIDQLITQGCTYIPSIINKVGKQYGTTKAASPGLSWHNWGEAIDFYCLTRARTADWNITPYEHVRDVIEEYKLKINFGPVWDYNHIQHRRTANPKGTGKTWIQIDEQLRAREEG